MADRYWVGGSNTWDSTVGTKWATSSGAAGGATVPSSSDNAFIDANSGTVTITVSSTRSCLNLDCTGFTGTLTGTSTPVINISGTSVIFGSGMTFAAAGPALTSFAATTIALTTNGRAIRAINSSTSGGGFILQDNLTAGLITSSIGSFDANDKNVTCEGFAMSGSTARTISMGNGAWVIGGSVQTALWNTTTVTGLTYNGEGATIAFNPSNATTYTIVPGTSTITNAVTILARGTSNTRINMSSGTINNLTINGPNSIQLGGSYTVPVGVINGLANDPVMLESSAIGTARSFTTSTGVTGRYVVIRDISKSGAGTFVVGPAIDLGNNTNVTINKGLPQATYAMGM